MALAKCGEVFVVVSGPCEADVLFTAINRIRTRKRETLQFGVVGSDSFRRGQVFLLPNHFGIGPALHCVEITAAADAWDLPDHDTWETPKKTEVVTLRYDLKERVGHLWFPKVEDSVLSESCLWDEFRNRGIRLRGA